MNCEIDEMEDGLEVELIDVKSTLNSDNFIKVKDIKSLTKIVEEDKGESGEWPCPSRGQNDFGPSKLFKTGTNRFELVQIVLFRFKLDFSGLVFIIWTCPN